MINFKDFLNPGIADLIPYVPGRPIESVMKEFNLQEVTKLASNENPWGPSANVMAALIDGAKELSFYPDSEALSLRTALAKKLNYPLDWIVLGNGSNEVIEILMRLFVRPSVSVVSHKYAFVIYSIITQALGGEYIECGVDENFRCHLTQMLEKITASTRMVLLANPNNPTGNYCKKHDLLNFIKKVPSNIVILIDEAYAEYVVQDDYASMLSVVKEYPNLVITRTFSKAYGLAALRLGYAILNPQLAKFYHQIREPFNINRLALMAGEIALIDELHIQQTRDENHKELQYVKQCLADMGLKTIPTIANFITVDTQRDGQKVFQSMMAKGVIVRPLNNYGMPQHLRITIGTREQNEKMLNALALALNIPRKA